MAPGQGVIATEVYKILRQVVGPWFRDNGFKTAKDYLTYRKPAGDRYFVVRFQCHHQGWEKHKGSKFTVFALLSDDAELEAINRGRLTEHLGLEQLEFIRARQNRVLASIPPPPADYVQQMVAGFERTFKDPKPYIDIYLADWKPVTRPYRASDDIWFRYYTGEDVKSWGMILLNHIQAIHAKEVA
jgi:hypothetical protein